MALHLHLKKGALHKDLGIASGKKIPLSKEKAAARLGSPLERKRAQFAINARKWHKEDRDTDLNNRIKKANKNLRQLGRKGAWFDDTYRRFDRDPPNTYSADGYKPHLDSHKAGWQTVRTKAKAELKNRTKQGKLQLEAVESLDELSKKMLTRYVGASHESSLDDIKKFPDRLEGEKRALDRLRGKYKARQPNGQLKRANYQMRAEDVDTLFEHWEPVDPVLETAAQFLVNEGLAHFLFGNVDRTPKKARKVTTRKTVRKADDDDNAFHNHFHNPKRDAMLARSAEWHAKYDDKRTPEQQHQDWVKQTAAYNKSFAAYRAKNPGSGFLSQLKGKKK
jgi:hypothetical protein